ncbi:MAG TPA: dihydropteroate synthase [Thermoanaerobaculia bacterium]|nr:dihydropteroate synthase [Thermoanaerobaculia bacterium]
MGVLNLTPDSFSDGGLWIEPERAVGQALRLLAEGADLLDLGAESTRPGGGVYGAGASTVSPEQEADRLLPVLAAVRRATDAPLSVDTRKGEVARRALDAGADLINDVSALGDPGLGRAVAAAGCPLVLMHSRGDLATMQRDIRFTDLLGEVRSELAEAMARAAACGIDPEQLVLDPGIGFGKTAEQNLALVGRLHELAVLGRPLLVGASRKSFIGRAVEQTGRPAPAPQERLPGSLAAAAWAAARSAAIVRVHDVAATVQFLAVWRAIGAQADQGAEGEV